MAMEDKLCRDSPGIVMDVLGLPAPQGSKRHVGGGRMVESSRKVGPWREAIVSQALRDGVAGRLLDGPLSFSAVFRMPRPNSHFGARGLKPSAPAHPTGTPDVDKLARSTLDGLSQAGVWVDDARVVILHVSKRFVLPDEATGALLHIGVVS
ncbi:MAG: RusA family crossover junction endodeoxyribonuclease [Actinomycetes bacterium]